MSALMAFVGFSNAFFLRSVCVKSALKQTIRDRDSGAEEGGRSQFIFGVLLVFEVYVPN